MTDERRPDRDRRAPSANGPPLVFSAAERSLLRAVCTSYITRGGPPDSPPLRRPSDGEIRAELQKLEDKKVPDSTFKGRLTKVYGRCNISEDERGEKRFNLVQWVFDNNVFDDWGADPAEQDAERTSPWPADGVALPLIPSHNDPEGPARPEPGTGSERFARSRRGIVAAIAGIAAVAVIGGMALAGDEEDAGDQRPAAPAKLAVRTLFVIDVTGTMRKDLNPDSPGEGSRIRAARRFASAGAANLTDSDRVGVWLFTNSKLGLPETCRWVPKTHCVLQRYGDATLARRRELRSRIRSAAANDGGTPLYEVIAAAVEALRDERDGDRDSARAVYSVVVVTDAIDHTRDDHGSALPLAAAYDGTNDVQVLITAIRQDLCDHEIHEQIVERFAARCVDASSIAKAEVARGVIRLALRTKLPPPRPRGGAPRHEGR